MPQHIICHGCKTMLYNGIELESPLEIIQRYNGVCPSCKRKLNFNPEMVRITPEPQSS